MYSVVPLIIEHQTSSIQQRTRAGAWNARPHMLASVTKIQCVRLLLSHPTATEADNLTKKHIEIHVLVVSINRGTTREDTKNKKELRISVWAS